MSLVSFIRRSWGDPFLRKSGIYFIGSMIVAFLNYLYYPVLARRLSLQDFGDVQALLSLWSQLSIIMGGFTMAAVHASVNCDTAGECRAVIRALRRSALLVVAGFFLILLFGASRFASALHFSNDSLMVVLAILLVTNTFYTLRNGYLQGKGSFGRIALGNILVSGGRLLFALLFIWVGWHSLGAIAGLVIAQLCALAFAYTKTSHDTIVTGEEPFVLTSARFKQELAYVGLVVCATSYVTALYVTDILIVKRFFEPTIAGGYSGISTIANIAYFITGPISAVLLSAVKRTHGRTELRKAYQKAFLLILLIGGSLVSLFILFPSFFIKLLIGSRYLPYAHLLPWLGGAFFFASLNNLSVVTGLALRRKRLILLAFSGISLLIFATIWRHASLEQIVQNFFVCDLIAASASFACLWPDIRQKNV